MKFLYIQQLQHLVQKQKQKEMKKIKIKHLKANNQTYATCIGNISKLKRKSETGHFQYICIVMKKKIGGCVVRLRSNRALQSSVALIILTEN